MLYDGLLYCSLTRDSTMTHSAHTPSANNVSHLVLIQLPIPIHTRQITLLNNTITVPDVPSLIGYEISAANSKNNGISPPSNNPIIDTSTAMTITFFCSELFAERIITESSSNGDGKTNNKIASTAMANPNKSSINF